MDETFYQIWIAVEAAAIKTTKTGLERSDIYDKALGIRKIESIDDKFTALDERVILSQHHSLIPTTLQIDPETRHDKITLDSLHDGLQFLSTMASRYALVVARQAISGRSKDQKYVNPIAKVVREWLQQLDKYSQTEIEHIVKSESWSYQFYSPMLLLGPSSFRSDAWQRILAEDVVAKALTKLYETICSATSCTHIAVNAAIPLGNASCSSFEDLSVNILRLPSQLTPIYGDFGARTELASEDAFKKALWVSTVQNGIHQVFAPIHTMFSRGNIKEKARILNLAQQETMPYSAVDLYSGIGYFAFSYAKGGAAIVLGWEINDWSVEGFRRGSKKNHWDVSVCKSKVSDSQLQTPWLDARSESVSPSPRLFIFAESNEMAPQRVRSLRDTIPPIRHVNCGYLPSSRQSWHSAVQCLDPDEGGCIHVHENVGIRDIDAQRSEIQRAFEVLVKAYLADHDLTVLCERVERVKSYAPGVWHCVFDIRIKQRNDEEQQNPFQLG